MRDVDHARLLAIFATSCPATWHTEGGLRLCALAFWVLDVDHAVFPAFFAMGGAFTIWYAEGGLSPPT